MKRFGMTFIVAMSSMAVMAQPANNVERYSPGVTFPQQGATPMQPRQVQQPVYPNQGVPILAPQGQQPVAPVSTPVLQSPVVTPPASTPASSGSSSGSSSRTGSSSRSGSGSSSSGSSSASSRSRTASSEKKTSNDSEKKSDSEEKKNISAESKSTEEAKKSEPESDSASALNKIVKNMESGADENSKAEEKAEAKKPEATPKPSKDELEAIKAREKAEQEAEKARKVVAEFLTEANDGVYSKATTFLAPSVRKYFDSEMSAVSGTKKSVMDGLTGNGTISVVTYDKTTVRGEGAIVEAELGFQDGRSVRRAFDLIKLDDEWKIVLPVSGGTVPHAAPAAPAAAQPAASAPAPAAPVSNPGSLSAAVEKAAAAAAVPTAEQAAQVPLVVAPPDTATTAPQQ